MPHCVASDLGLHCLPMSHKKDAKLIWVKFSGDSQKYTFVINRFDLTPNACPKLTCIAIFAAAKIKECIIFTIMFKINIRMSWKMSFVIIPCIFIKSKQCHIMVVE